MIRPIRTKKQYKEYLGQAYELMQTDLKPKSQASDDLEMLSILIEKYEKEHYPLAPPHPTDEN